MRVLHAREDCPAGKQFYLCAGSANSPPFKGCCSIDPCNKPCPDGNDSAIPGPSSTASQAVTTRTSTVSSSRSISSSASNDVTIATVPLSTPASISQTSAASGTSASSTSISTTTPPASVQTPQSSGSGSKHNKPIGGYIGLAVALVLILFLVALFFFIRRRRKRKQVDRESSTLTSPLPPSYRSPTLSTSSKDVFAEFGGYFRRASEKSKSMLFSSSSPPLYQSPTMGQGKIGDQKGPNSPPQMLDGTPIIAELPAERPISELPTRARSSPRQPSSARPDSSPVPMRHNTKNSTYSIPIRLGSPISSTSPAIEERMLGDAVPTDEIGPTLLASKPGPRPTLSERRRANAQSVDGTARPHLMSWMGLQSDSGSGAGQGLGIAGVGNDNRTNTESVNEGSTKAEQKARRPFSEGK